LARQFLLERDDRSAAEAIEHLVGLQAQAPDAPYVALWSRLSGFRTDDLATLLLDRAAVRMSLYRATIHLVTARDCLRLRPLIQVVLERSFAGSPFAKYLDGVDMAALVQAGRTAVDEEPRTRGGLREVLLERWPDRDPDSLAYAITYNVPMVQLPPRGIWGQRGAVAWTSTENWLGCKQEVPGPSALDDLVLRYLGAFGPGSVKDAQLWSGLTRLREVFDRLVAAQALRSFRDEAGVELYDLPDAPRPEADRPAPPRFLPEYDNLLLSHAERSRIIEDGRPVPLPPGNGGAIGTLLVDGFFRATWRVTRSDDSATLTVEPFASLPGADADAVTEEGQQLLDFVAPGASHDIRFAVP
jgi:hypothetical protein